MQDFSPIGLYGGTFDPIHRGHIHAALSILKTLGLDAMHMVLSARPGHRGAPGSSVQDRWHMLCLACEVYPNLIPDDHEVSRKGVSYTYDTVKEYHESGHIPNWLVGMDSFVTMPEWYRWREIFDYCNLVVFERPGTPPAYPAALSKEVAVRQVAQLDKSELGQIWMAPDTMLDISATQIRAKTAASQDASDLLEEAVWSYIRQHNLYTEGSV